MPEQRTVLNIFVASPSDVSEERDLVAEVVSHLNRVWAKKSGLHLDLVRWETDTYAAFGTDPQSVINEQIGDEYDVIIGILWSRFGSPTPRYESGTAEEFERAYDRFSEEQRPAISIYFKDTPLSPSKVDPRQLGKILEFKRKVEQKGGLYKLFTTPEDFRRQLDLQLSRIVQEFADKQGAEIRPVPVGVAEVSEDDEQDLLGFLDYLEMANDGIANVGDAAGKIATDIKVWGTKPESITSDIKAALDRNDLKHIVRYTNKAADAFDSFARDVKVHKNEMRRYSDSAVENFRDAIDLSSNFEPIEKKAKQELLDGLFMLNESLRVGAEAIVAFGQPIRSMPPVNKKLNKAKRVCVQILDDTQSDLQAMLRMWSEAMLAAEGLPTERNS